MKSMKSLLFVIFWYPLSGLCTSRFWLQESERGIIACFVFVLETNWYYLLIHSFMLHCPLIRIWFFDLVCLDFNPNITFKSSVYCKSSDFLQYFWGFHPWILLNPRICQIYSLIVWFLQYQGNFRFCNFQYLKW